MKSKVFLLGTLVALMSLNASASNSFRCFSKYYTANQSTISFSGNVMSDTVITSFKMVDQNDGINLALPAIKADPNYNPRNYKGYSRYFVAQNPAGGAFQALYVLLPGNLKESQGQFLAYVSDANADGSGSDGYFKALCVAQ